jgi:hypothetical protein
MLASALQLIFGVVALYLCVGVVLLVPIHRSVLPRIDKACTNAGLGFRALLSPGIITFWPLLLLRGRRAAPNMERSGALEKPLGPYEQRRLHQLAWFFLAVFGPLVMIVALAYRGAEIPPTQQVRAATDIPDGSQSSGSYGALFSSIPADVSLGRQGMHDYGLVFRFHDATATVPVALYWSQSLGDDGSLSPNAVFLGIIAGPEPAWVTFSRPEMETSGFWVTYSFSSHEIEAVPVPESGKGAQP